MSNARRWTTRVTGARPAGTPASTRATGGCAATTQSCACSSTTRSPSAWTTGGDSGAVFFSAHQETIFSFQVPRLGPASLHRQPGRCWRFGVRPDVHTKSRTGREALKRPAAMGRVALDRFEVRVQDHDEPAVVRAERRLDRWVASQMLRCPTTSATSRSSKDWTGGLRSCPVLLLTQFATTAGVTMESESPTPDPAPAPLSTPSPTTARARRAGGRATEAGMAFQAGVTAWLAAHLVAGMPVGSRFGLSPTARIRSLRCETGEDLYRLVRHVMIHEIGHHFGFSDADMEFLESQAG